MCFQSQTSQIYVEFNIKSQASGLKSPSLESSCFLVNEVILSMKIFIRTAHQLFFSNLNFTPFACVNLTNMGQQKFYISLTTQATNHDYLYLFASAMIFLHLLLQSYPSYLYHQLIKPNVTQLFLLFSQISPLIIPLKLFDGNRSDFSPTTVPLIINQYADLNLDITARSLI